MIRYDIMHDSKMHYESHSYHFIEVPWTVSNEIISITYPIAKEENSFYLHGKDKSLIASGEQGFLALYNKGFLPKGKFQTITPCFRDETFDETHTKYFVKSELINTENVSEDAMWSLIDTSFTFFQKWVKNPNKLCLNIIDTQTVDIEYDGVEIGSYGIRECSFLKWIFGTGVAEPRFSRIKDR